MEKSDFQRLCPSFTHRICERLDITEDICRQCGYVEIVSNTCALVDGCKSVLEYDENLIKLSFGKSSVAFHGTDLSIKSLSLEQAMVEGFIMSVEYGN